LVKIIGAVVMAADARSFKIQAKLRAKEKTITMNNAWFKFNNIMG
jgi:hypothetical protein